MNVQKGSKITIICGSRLRRVSDDGKAFLDQRMGEGALVEKDLVAEVVGVVEGQAAGKTAVVVDVRLESKKLFGWVYAFEIAPSASR